MFDSNTAAAPQGSNPPSPSPDNGTHDAVFRDECLRADSFPYASTIPDDGLSEDPHGYDAGLEDPAAPESIDGAAASGGFFGTLTDQDLLLEVSHLAARERQATADLIAALVEVDRRRLYLAEGCSSLYIYCTHRLHLSEHAAYGRIQAARAVRRFPALMPMLIEGSVTLTTICLLAPHLTDENHISLLAAARHRSKRHVELLIARLRPQADVPSSIPRTGARPVRSHVRGVRTACTASGRRG
jgi:hypothetical protein